MANKSPITPSGVGNKFMILMGMFLTTLGVVAVYFSSAAQPAPFGRIDAVYCHDIPFTTSLSGTKCAAWNNTTARLSPLPVPVNDRKFFSVVGISSGISPSDKPLESGTWKGILMAKPDTSDSTVQYVPIATESHIPCINVNPCRVEFKNIPSYAVTSLWDVIYGNRYLVKIKWVGKDDTSQEVSFESKPVTENINPPQVPPVGPPQAQ